jgi:hypothetical protein
LRERWGDKILDDILYFLALDVIRDTIYAVKYRDTFTEKAPKWFKRCRRKFAKILTERMREEVEKRLERGEYTEIITKDGQRIRCVDWKGSGWFVVDGDLLWLPWMDHMKYTRDGKVVSEPYALDYEKVKKLIDFCEKAGLTFIITGDSYHFPTRTLRIIIYPPEPDRYTRERETRIKPVRMPREEEQLLLEFYKRWRSPETGALREGIGLARKLVSKIFAELDKREHGNQSGDPWFPLFLLGDLLEWLEVAAKRVEGGEYGLREH